MLPVLLDCREWRRRRVRPGTNSEPMSLLKINPMTHHQLLQIANEGYLYALVDACDEPLVPPKMEDLGDEKALSLFKGGTLEDYFAVAPYLVHINKDILRWVFENLWKEPWGIFILAKSELLALHAHFRKFLIVRLPNERDWFFRYYDPRILRPYLVSCNAWEMFTFYGPSRAFVISEPTEDKLCVLSPQQAEPSTNKDNIVDSGQLRWRIRPEQIRFLNEAHRNSFLDRMSAQLRQNYAEVTNAFSPGRLVETITEGIGRAKSYDIELCHDVERFIHLMFTISLDFDTNPATLWIREILYDTSLTTQSKLDNIEGCWALICNTPS